MKYLIIKIESVCAKPCFLVAIHIKGRLCAKQEGEEANCEEEYICFCSGCILFTEGIKWLIGMAYKS